MECQKEDDEQQYVSAVTHPRNPKAAAIGTIYRGANDCVFMEILQLIKLVIYVYLVYKSICFVKLYTIHYY